MNILGKLLDTGKALGQMLPNQDTNTDKLKQPQKLGVEQLMDKFDQHNSAVIGSKVLFHSFSAQFSQFSSFAADFNQSIKEIEEKNESLFDFEKVAENVLGFIGKTIRGAKEGGADDDKVGRLLDAARTGVLQGVEDAKKDLGGLNMLDEDLEEGIDKSLGLINDGIDDIAEELLPNLYPQKAENDVIRDVSREMLSGVYASSEMTSDLSITTADGDKITISFSAFLESMQGEYAATSQNGNGSQAVYGYQQESYSEINFSYKVEGELDEDEREAIAVLVKDINDLQKDFFNGDVESAFEKALELGIESDEITNVSLNLAKVETTVVTQAYREIEELKEPEQNSPQAELAQVTKPIADYVDRFNQLQEVADKILESNRQYFKELMENVIKADTPAEPAVLADKLARFQTFHEGLFKESE